MPAECQNKGQQVAKKTSLPTMSAEIGHTFLLLLWLLMLSSDADSHKIFLTLLSLYLVSIKHLGAGKENCVKGQAVKGAAELALLMIHKGAGAAVGLCQVR